MSEQSSWLGSRPWLPRGCPSGLVDIPDAVLLLHRQGASCYTNSFRRRLAGDEEETSFVSTNHSNLLDQLSSLYPEDSYPPMATSQDCWSIVEKTGSHVIRAAIQPQA